MNEQFKDIYSGITDKMEKSLVSLGNEFNSVRAGRANPAVLDQIKVEYYGVPSQINAVAGVSVPDARTIIIQPWDASILKEVEKAILASDIGINPNNDGKSIRLNFPPLTEERRKDLVKQIHKIAENGKVAVRNIRRDAMDIFKDMKKKSEITEDDLKSAEKDLQDITDKYIKKIDQKLEEKEKDLMAL
ncbi:MAG: ribosome recycling factor [Bacillota bacterium]|nr:ribosome recycling factor [Bacillota bacterium]